jgi:hypothetical protein
LEENKLLAEIASTELPLEESEKSFNEWIKTRPEFKDILELIGQTSNPQIRKHLLQEISAVLILILKRCSQAKIHWVAQQKIIQKIAAFRAPHLRYQALICLTHFLCLAPNNFDKTFSNNLLKLENQYSEAQAATVFLAYLNLLDIKTEHLVKILNTPRITKELKNYEKLQILITFLDALKDINIKPDQKSIILSLVCRNETDKLFVRLQQLTTIIQIGETDRLTTIDCSLETQYNLILNEHLLDLDIENIGEKWMRTFGASRAPHAVFTYFGQIASLDNEDDMDSLQKYISWVLNGSFQEDRYKEDLDQLPPEKLEIWKKGLTADLNHIEKKMRSLSTRGLDEAKTLSGWAPTQLHATLPKTGS